MIPTATINAKTRKIMESAGYLVTKVERYSPHSRRLIDHYGIGDYEGIDSMRRGKILVQSTSRSNYASRLTKVMGHDSSTRWLRNSDDRLYVVAWDKHNGRWRPKITEIVIRDGKLTPEDREELT